MVSSYLPVAGRVDKVEDIGGAEESGWVGFTGGRRR